jgi:hypothetical protein
MLHLLRSPRNCELIRGNEAVKGCETVEQA